jgi:hypothetical protein
MFIYESPDKGKTIYRRNFGSIERFLIRSQEDNITQEVMDILKDIGSKAYFRNEILIKAKNK